MLLICLRFHWHLSSSKARWLRSWGACRLLLAPAVRRCRRMLARKPALAQPVAAKPCTHERPAFRAAILCCTMLCTLAVAGHGTSGGRDRNIAQGPQSPPHAAAPCDTAATNGIAAAATAGGAGVLPSPATAPAATPEHGPAVGSSSVVIKLAHGLGVTSAGRGCNSSGGRGSACARNPFADAAAAVASPQPDGLPFAAEMAATAASLPVPDISHAAGVAPAANSEALHALTSSGAVSVTLG